MVGKTHGPALGHERDVPGNISCRRAQWGHCPISKLPMGRGGNPGVFENYLDKIWSDRTKEMAQTRTRMSCTVFFGQNISDRTTSDVPEESMKLQILHSLSFVLALPYFISMITKTFLRSHQALLHQPTEQLREGERTSFLIFVSYFHTIKVECNILFPVFITFIQLQWKTPISFILWIRAHHTPPFSVRF